MWRLQSEILDKGDGGQVMETILDQVINAQDFLNVVRTLSDDPKKAQSGVLELKDGRVIEHYSQPQSLGDKVNGRVWSFRDITDRRKAVEALFRSEDRFRQVVENAEECIWEVDAEGLYTYVSPVVQRIIGYSSEEMVGRLHFYELFHPEDRDRLKQKIFEVFGRGETFREFESRNLHKDGQEVWLSKSGVPMLDDHQRVIGYRGVDVDVTERRRIHEILHRKQKNLEAIFDAAPIGMLLVDEQMRVRRANDSIRDLSGKDYPEIINQFPGHVLGCIHAADNPANCETRCGDKDACAECVLCGTIRRAVESGLPMHGVEIQPSLRIRGQEVSPSLSVSTEPVVIDGTKYAVVSINDVTDRAKAERELRETMEIKSQFISTVSHELRTPLASMKEAVLIVLDGVAGPLNEDQRHFLDVAKRNIDRLWRLINEVLDFQKLGAGKMKFHIQENDLGKVVEDAYSTMLPYASKRRIHLSLSVESNLPKGQFDSDRLIQVITNLLSNAVKFTPEDGKVSIDLGRKGDEFVLRVSDTGLGIPKEALGRIFDRFYRVNRPGKEIKGTGLGLAIVKAIVLAHGGHIEVASEVDQGTTFTVFLPLAPKLQAEMSESGDRVIEAVVG
jgi:PAS domain S-box-containing protein